MIISRRFIKDGLKGMKKKKTKIEALLILFIFISVIFNTIGYSILNSELSISGEAHVRVSELIRITNLKVISKENGAYETYNNKYSKDTTSMFLTLPNSDSTLTYEIEVTNNSSDKYMLADIIESSFTNSNISYQFIDIDIGYVINENSVIKFQIKFTTNNSDQNTSLVLNYVFEKFKEYNVFFDFKGDSEKWTAPYNGIYKIELWSASGGNEDFFRGGRGGYTSGDIYLEKGTEFYVFVGGMGISDVTSANYTKTGGFNGGGYGSYGYVCAGGGGDTDIRLIVDNGFSRIMVAGAGGGACSKRTDIKLGGAGGSGGGLTGHAGNNYYGTSGAQVGGGGTQTSGGYGYDAAHYGSFDYGANSPEPLDDRAGGGGGYYGGGASYGTVGAGGGSSFISGHPGCDAVTSSSTIKNIIHTGQSIHYSGLKFTNTRMIDGDSSMPTYDGTGTMIGNTGNGFAKITLVNSH